MPKEPEILSVIVSGLQLEAMEEKRSGSIQRPFISSYLRCCNVSGCTAAASERSRLGAAPNVWDIFASRSGPAAHVSASSKQSSE